MIASMWAAFSSTRTARDGAWSGTLCRRALSSTCSTSPRGSATSAPARADGAERVGGRTDRGAQCVFRLAEVQVLGWRFRRHRIHRPRQRGRLRFELGLVLEFVVLEVRDQTHRGRRIAPDDEGLAGGHRVALELGARRAARAHRRAPAAPRRWPAPRAPGRPPCAPSAAATPRPRRSGRATATRCGRPLPSHRQLRNALAPIAITHPGRRQARRRLRARRWPKPTGRHWGTT